MAVSDHPFIRPWQQPSPVKAGVAQTMDEVRTRMCLMERKSLLKLLESKALDGAGATLHLREDKDYYVSQVLS